MLGVMLDTRAARVDVEEEAVWAHVCSAMHWITVDIAYLPPVLSASPTVGQLLSPAKTVLGHLQCTRKNDFLNESDYLYLSIIYFIIDPFNKKTWLEKFDLKVYLVYSSSCEFSSLLVHCVGPHPADEGSVREAVPPGKLPCLQFTRHRH